MEIKHIELTNRGAFVIKDEGDRLAEMTYARTDNGINIDHTQVDEKLRGQGIGESLLAAAVTFAREKGFKVEASCPYASKKLSENGDYADVFAGRI